MDEQRLMKALRRMRNLLSLLAIKSDASVWAR